MKHRYGSMLSCLLFAIVFAVAAVATPVVAGQGASEGTTVAAKCGKCGDGQCVASCGENAITCPKDCGVETESRLLVCGKCGDGRCTPQCGETSESCPKDCGVESEDALVLESR